MRKILVIAFFFICTSSVFAQNNNLSLFPNIKVGFIQEIDFSKKLDFTIPDCFINLTHKTYGFNLTKSNHDYNYGFYLDLSSTFQNFPIKISAGTINLSGLHQKLINPKQSSITSPFFLIKPISCTKSSLPSMSSSNKKISSMINIDYKLPKYILQEINSSIIFQHNFENEQNILSFESNLLIRPKINLLFDTAILFQTTHVSNLSSDLWYLDNNFFDFDILNSAFQFNINYNPKQTDIKKIQFNTTIYSFFNPQNFMNFAINNQFMVNFDKLNFSNEIFINPFNQIITSKGNLVDPSLSIKTGIFEKNIIKAPNTPLFVKTGITSYFDIDFLTRNCILKQTGACQFFNSDVNYKLQINTKESIEKAKFIFEDLTINVLIKPSLNNVIYPIFDFSLYYNFYNQNMSQKINFELYFNKDINIINKTSIEIIEKQHQISKLIFQCSLSTTFKLKKISCTGKLSTAYSINF